MWVPWGVLCCLGGILSTPEIRRDERTHFGILWYGMVAMNAGSSYLRYLRQVSMVTFLFSEY